MVPGRGETNGPWVRSSYGRRLSHELAGPLAPYRINGMASFLASGVTRKILIPTFAFGTTANLFYASWCIRAS